MTALRSSRSLTSRRWDQDTVDDVNDTSLDQDIALDNKGPVDEDGWASKGNTDGSAIDSGDLLALLKNSGVANGTIDDVVGQDAGESITSGDLGEGSEGLVGRGEDCGIWEGVDCVEEVSLGQGGGESGQVGGGGGGGDVGGDGQDLIDDVDDAAVVELNVLCSYQYQWL